MIHTIKLKTVIKVTIENTTMIIRLCIPGFAKSLAVLADPGSPFLAPVWRRPVVPFLGSGPAAFGHNHSPVYSSPPAARGAPSALHPADIYLSHDWRDTR